MDIKIVDSSGKEYGLKIDENNRAHVDAVSNDKSIVAAIDGESYNVNTGTITLTSANESSLLYIKNNENKNIVIKEILAIIGSSTGGSGTGTINILKNPTGGTVVSTATNVDIVENRNFGSSRVLNANVYKGTEAATLTGSVDFAESSRSSFPTVISFDATAIILQKGNSLGVSFTPPTSNTSQDIKIAVTLYLE